jgi:hypothetical protein
MLNAQKLIRKSVLDSKVSCIIIDAEYCYQVVLSTSETKEIVIHARIEGEYKNNLLVKIKHIGPSIEVSAGFHPNNIPIFAHLYCKK